jgi:protease stability complex PrcB-like protein
MKMIQNKYGRDSNLKEYDFSSTFDPYRIIDRPQYFLLSSATGFLMICGAIITLLSAVSSGCGHRDDSQTVSPVAFSIVDTDSNSGIQSFRTASIQDSNSWNALWAEHKRNMVPTPAPPAFDFSQKMVLGVFLGSRPNACYSVQITSISIIDNQKLQVVYHENTPPGNAVCAAVITYPSQIVALDNSNLQVEFVGQ